MCVTEGFIRQNYFRSSDEQKGCAYNICTKNSTSESVYPSKLNFHRQNHCISTQNLHIHWRLPICKYNLFDCVVMRLISGEEKLGGYIYYKQFYSRGIDRA